jgi:hypothetical protein
VQGIDLPESLHEGADLKIIPAQYELVKSDVLAFDEGFADPSLADLQAVEEIRGELGEYFTILLIAQKL